MNKWFDIYIFLFLQNCYLMIIEEDCQIRKDTMISAGRFWPNMVPEPSWASGRIFVSKEAAVLHLGGVEGESKRDTMERCFPETRTPQLRFSFCLLLSPKTLAGHSLGKPKKYDMHSLLIVFSKCFDLGSGMDLSWVALFQSHPNSPAQEFGCTHHIPCQGCRSPSWCLSDTLAFVEISYCCRSMGSSYKTSFLLITKL